MSASGGIPGFVRGNQAPTTARKATVLSIGVRTGCAARLANLAKRVECGQLAGAFGPPTASQSGSKLHALHALRDIRLLLFRLRGQGRGPRSPRPASTNHRAPVKKTP